MGGAGSGERVEKAGERLRGEVVIGVAKDARGDAKGAKGPTQARLKHVFAVLEPDMLAGKDIEKITVFLSDQPVPADLRKASDAWRFWAESQFRCTVIHPPAVSGVLTGAAAQNSPQYKAVVAFLQACRKKDLDAILKSVDPSSGEALAQMVSANGKESTLGMLAEVAAEALGFKLNKVTLRGDTAEVELAGSEPGWETVQTLRVVLHNGE